MITMQITSEFFRALGMAPYGHGERYAVTEALKVIEPLIRASPIWPSEPDTPHTTEDTTMGTEFCSLINKAGQIIQPNKYTELRYGPDESSDHAAWHQNTDTTKRASALIIPRVTGVGHLWAKIGWQNPADAGGTIPTKYYAKFVRDPWTDDEDQTGAQHFAPVPFTQNHVTCWHGVLFTDQPLALMVMHNGSTPLTITVSEFKASVHI